MNCRLLGAVAGLALMLGGGAAFAGPTTFAGSFSITDTGNLISTNNLNVIDVPTGAFSVSLHAGQTAHDVTLTSFLTTDPDPKHNILPKFATDTVTGTFDFSKPVANITNVDGTVTEGVSYDYGFLGIGAHYASGGGLVWDSSNFDVHFSDGAVLNVQLGPTLFANLNGTSNSGVISADFKLCTDPDPVPEPAGLALLGSGLLGLGVMRCKTNGRRRLALAA